MSCDGNRHKFWQHLTSGKNPFSALLGGSAAAAQQTLERVYQRGKAEAERRLGSGQVNEVEKALATSLTQKLFDRMRKAGIKPPTHSKDGLPKMSSRFGYAAAYRTLAAVESGQTLPPDARAVLQMSRGGQGSGKSQPKATLRGGSISAVGFDTKGYYRCANCGRFASQTRGHVCPFTASEAELSRMLSRRLGLPPNAWQGYRGQALQRILAEGRDQGVVTMVHDLTGAQVQVTLDGIPQAMMGGYIPQEWAGNTVLVEQEGRFYSVVSGEGLHVASDPAGMVQQVAQKYGIAIPPDAPVLQAVNLQAGLKQPPTPGNGPLALEDGQTYDLGHFIGTEFRKNDARGTFIEAGGKRYGVYARSKNPADRSSARGRFAPLVDAIVVGRTLPAAVEILRTGSVATDADGKVSVYDASGSLLAVYDPATNTAGDTAGNPNASPEQMAAVLAHRMQHPQSAFDYALIQDFAAFSQGQGSPIAAADSAYLAIRNGYESADRMLTLGARITQGGLRKCPQCGRFIGSKPHVCPAQQTAGNEQGAQPAPVAVQETPAAPTAPLPEAAQVNAPVVNVTVTMPNDFADTLRDVVRDILGQTAPPVPQTVSQPAPATDPSIAAALSQLAEVLAAQQQAIERLQQTTVQAPAGSAAPVDIESLGVAIGQAVASSIPAPQIVSGGDGQVVAAPARPRKCPKCGQYMGENHTCPPRVERRGLRRPEDLPPTETEKILSGVQLPAPDLYLDNVPEEWGGQRAVPLPENVPDLKPEYEMGQQERLVFNMIAMQLRKKSKRPTNRAFGLYGPAGTGKNTIARQLAASLKTDDGKQGLPYQEINITPDMDIQQAIGEVVLTTDENGNTVSRVRLGPIGLIAAGGGVAAVNEIVRSPKLATALQSIIEDGELSIPTPEGGAYKIPVHPSAIFIATWNPGYEGDADRPAQAFLSRITALPLNYPSKEEQIRRLEAYFTRENLPLPAPEVMDAAVGFWNELRVLTGATGETPQVGAFSPTRTTPGPRELARFVEYGTQLGWDEALQTLEIICDQDAEYFPVQKSILHDRFESHFGGLV